MADNIFDRSQYKEATKSVSKSDANAFLMRVFSIMGLGLVITGITAFFFAQAIAQGTVQMSQGLMYFLMFLPLGFVLLMSFGINRMSYMTASIVFGLYAVSMGLSLSFIFFVYSLGAISSTFFITAGMFGAMAAIGYTTKRDLTKMGTYLFMALIGLIIAMVVNFFIGSSIMEFIISVIGVIIFAGLTAYDVQRLLWTGMQGDIDGEVQKKNAVMGALALYLDFINMFLFLLRIFGGRD